MTHHDHARVSVFDALHEYAAAHPEHASDDGQLLRPHMFRAALRLVPDEHRAPLHLSLRDQFVESVVANALAAGRNPYTVAEFTLDV